MADEGYAAVTFDRIGDLAGFSRGLAGQKFGSKEGMILALVAYLSERIEQKHNERLGSLADPVEEVVSFVESFFDEVRIDPLNHAYFALLAATIGNHLSTRSAFIGAHERIKRSLADMIARGQAAGLVDPALDPADTALAIGSFQLGISTQARLDPGFDVERIGGVAIAAIRKLLKP